MKKIEKYLLALPLAIAMLCAFGVTSASAATPEMATADQTTSSSAAITAELTPTQIADALAELRASPVPRESELVGSTIQTRFQFNKDFGMTFVEPAPGAISPQLAGGWDGGGAYILFNQFDQDVIISGAGLALGAAICAIPGVGWAACTVVGVIIGAGALYLSYNGKCSNNRQLKAYTSGRIAGCV